MEATQFSELTGAPPATAAYYLSTFGSLDAAISGYFDSGGAQPPASAETAAAGASATTSAATTFELPSDLPLCEDAALAAEIAAKADALRPVDPAQRLFADECAYSFDTPYEASGLYLNLATQVAVGAEHLVRAGAGLYLLQRWSRVRNEAAVAAAAAAYARMLCSPLVVCTRRSPPQQEAVAASEGGGHRLRRAATAGGDRVAAAR